MLLRPGQQELRTYCAVYGKVTGLSLVGMVFVLWLYRTLNKRLILSADRTCRDYYAALRLLSAEAMSYRVGPDDPQPC
jgi:hypothetical protein